MFEDSTQTPGEFQASWLIRGGHVQTLAGFFYWGGGPVPATETQRRHVVLDDGDQVVIHDDQPADWFRGAPVTLLVHGLGGCHQSGYMRRTAWRLTERGVRTFRMDMRGCGAGLRLAQHPPHSGRTGDVAAVLRDIAVLCPGSPLHVVGFSLGGNLILNALADGERLAQYNVASGLAVCPPVDLAHCSRSLQQGFSRLYDRFFTQILWQYLSKRRRENPEAPDVPIQRRPATLWEFDDTVTAPLCGFAGATDYYTRTSSGPRLNAIETPTLIIAAADDPLIPIESVTSFARSPNVSLHVTPGGGHLGFISRTVSAPDRRWLDWRIIDWIEKAA